MKIRLPAFKLNLTISAIKELSFILFFCSPLIIRGFQRIGGIVGLQSMGRPLVIVLIYLFVLVVMLKSPGSIPVDFFFLLGGVLFFIGATYLVHPEYKFWYLRPYYGVWDYVLRPDNGIYAYFFVRLLNDPNRIKSGLKKASWIMYGYYLFILIDALRVGYWVNTNAKGQTVHMSYDLSYGYDLLFFMLVFLYDAMTNKRITDIAMAAAGAVMIFLAGSRGPLLCVAIFVVLYMLVIAEGKKKWRNIILLITGCTVVFLLYKPIIMMLVSLLESKGLSSRTLDMMLEGTMADDTGRNRIWNAAVQMIRDNPFGYGALGTRHVIYYYHDVGHCHQLFLEILVDFGLIAGSILILYLLSGVVKIFLFTKDLKWKSLFLIFFSRACQLLLSGTYWHVVSFWGCLGIGVSIYYANKRKLRNN